MQQSSPALDLARRHGLIPSVMATDIRRLVDGEPALVADQCRLASRLRGLGYSAGEIDARLMMAGRAS